MAKKNNNNVVTLDLDPVRALQIVREIAEDSARVFFTEHAEKRMKQRKISRTQVLKCFAHGQITEGPVRSASGNWTLTMEVLTAGDIVTVVSALDHDEDGNYILVITSY